MLCVLTELCLCNSEFIRVLSLESVRDCGLCGVRDRGRAVAPSTERAAPVRRRGVNKPDVAFCSAQDL
eukprot:4824611-Prymnesium_polylepis.1